MKPSDLPVLAQKETEAQAKFKSRLLCCGSTACLASGGGVMKEALVRSLKSHKLEKDVQVVQTGCMGLCSHGPMMRAEFPGQPATLYEHVTGEVALRIVDEQLAPPVETPAEEPTGPYDIPHFRASAAWSVTSFRLR